MGSPFKTFKMASSNLPPELIERINKPSIAHVSETSHWLTRHQNVRSSKNLESQSIDWLTTNQIGDPSKTAWMINEKGNKVWFTPWILDNKIHQVQASHLHQGIPLTLYHE